MGTSRIDALLKAGIQNQEFNLALENTQNTARLIQLLITGALISRATEKREHPYWIAEKEMLVRQILNMAKI